MTLQYPTTGAVTASVSLEDRGWNVVDSVRRRQTATPVGLSAYTYDHGDGWILFPLEFKLLPEGTAAVATAMTGHAGLKSFMFDLDKVNGKVNPFNLYDHNGERFKVRADPQAFKWVWAPIAGGTAFSGSLALISTT